MEYRFSLDEVSNLIKEAIQEGYHYGSIEIVEPDNEIDQSGEGAVLWLICDDCGGEDGAEFDPIESVPLTEIAGYGNKGQDPAPWRLSGKVEE